MDIIGVCGGNGVILHPMRKSLVANYEPRSLFRTRNDIQWYINFEDIPIYNHPLDFFDHYRTRIINGVDVIVGAPDCGHSSVLAYSRAKKTSDPLKNDSFNLFLRSVKMSKPKVFMMENLAKVLEMVPKEVFKETFPEYKLIFLIGSVEMWGNSQRNRKRLVLIGLHRPSFGKNLAEARDHFTNVYKINKTKNCEELLSGLESLSGENGHIRESITDVITLYAGYKDSLHNIQKFWELHPHLKRWPVSDRNFTTAPGVYRNLAHDLPATARKANRQFNHEGLQMSPRELARIQGVPDKFKIYTDTDELTYWINKGRTTVTKTPPYEIGKWFYKQLKEVRKLWKSSKST